MENREKVPGLVAETQQEVAPAPEEFRFGRCVVRRWTREILLDGVLQPAERRTFDVVCYLIVHRERVVPKEELLDNIWRNRWVSESVIAQSILKARRVIGDLGPAPHVLIKTFHRVGYRFIGELDTA